MFWQEIAIRGAHFELCLIVYFTSCGTWVTSLLFLPLLHTHFLFSAGCNELYSPIVLKIKKCVNSRKGKNVSFVVDNSATGVRASENLYFIFFLTFVFLAVSLTD